MDPAPPVRTVGVLVFEGVELLDFAGPAEVFIVAGEGRLFRVVTVAASRAPLRTMGGVTLVPEVTYAEAPDCQILVLPGGDLSQVGPDAIAWLTQASARAEVTLSVCFGAFLLAKAGLLKGLEATTHAWGQARLRAAEPTCTVVSGRRFVDAGRIVSTAGVTAGIDGALHVVERLHGPEQARWTGQQWMEHCG